MFSAGEQQSLLTSVFLLPKKFEGKERERERETSSSTCSLLNFLVVIHLEMIKRRKEEKKRKRIRKLFLSSRFSKSVCLLCESRCFSHSGLVSLDLSSNGFILSRRFSSFRQATTVKHQQLTRFLHSTQFSSIHQ